MGYTSSLKEIYSRFQEICKTLNTLCINASETELFRFILPFIESFYYVPPKDCIEVQECFDNLIDMIKITTKLSLEGKYIYYINEERLKGIVKELQYLDSLTK